MNESKYTSIRGVRWGLFLIAGVCWWALLDPSTLLAAASEGKAALPLAKIFDWRKFLAPFHSVVLHYPIGFVTLAFVLEIYSLRHGSPQLRKIITLVIILSAITSVLAAGLGWLRATDGGYDPRTLELHRWYGVSVVAITLVALWVQGQASRRESSGVLLQVYRVLLVVNLAVLVAAGHQGGNLTHGSNYLTKDAPEFVKNLIEDDAANDVSGAGVGGASEKDKLFLEQIQPVFKAKCHSCHGPEKQKAGYRLDQKETAFKGGESNKVAIKPGDPLESNLVKLILLPVDHDDVMPPSGKEMLTADETMKIIRWIQSGAHFPEVAKAASAPPAAPATAPAPAK